MISDASDGRSVARRWGVSYTGCRGHLHSLVSGVPGGAGVMIMGITLDLSLTCGYMAYVT